MWPYESGEVIVQSYNTLLTLATLVDAADSVVLVQNQARAPAPAPVGAVDCPPVVLLLSCTFQRLERRSVIAATRSSLSNSISSASAVACPPATAQVLHNTATKLLGIQRPSFGDLNEIASRSLASVLLPARWRPADPAAPGASAAEPGRPVQMLGALPGSRARPGVLALLRTHAWLSAHTVRRQVHTFSFVVHSHAPHPTVSSSQQPPAPPLPALICMSPSLPRRYRRTSLPTPVPPPPLPLLRAADPRKVRGLHNVQLDRDA